MARRRMIEVSISHDKELNSLSDFAQLLFLKILPHTDDFGRFEGDPVVVKARVDPLSMKKVSVYEKAMQDISTAKLWVWYETPDGKKVVQYQPKSFERINAFLIKNRGNSEYPPYKESYKLISIDMLPYPIEGLKTKAKSIKQKAERAEIPEELKTAEFENVWLEFIESRIYIKKPLTKLAEEKHFKELLKVDIQTAIAMVEQSVKNQWQGIFELTTNGKKNGITQQTTRKSDQTSRATFRHTPEQLAKNKQLEESIGLLYTKRDERTGIDTEQTSKPADAN